MRSMDTKILIIGVVAIVAIGGVAAFFALGGGGGGGGSDSDYALLDSDDNIKKGLTIEMKGKLGDGSANNKYVVKSVSGDTVEYSQKNEMKDIEETLELDSVSPARFESSFGFDYTDPDTIPEGVTVTINADKYKISGTVTTYSLEYTFNLTIVYDDDDEEVISAEGTMKAVESKNEMSYKLKTVDGELIATIDRTSSSTETCDVDKFYDNVLTEFDEDNYKGAEITEKDGKFGGVNVKIYTINGTVHDQEYKNVKAYVYDGYTIHMEGKLVEDGKTRDVSMTVTVHA